MKNIVIYNVIDGDIVRCVTCPEGMVEIQCRTGEAYIEHDRIDDTLYKVDLETLQIVEI